MVVVLSSCEYFRIGFCMLAEDIVKEHHTFSEVVFVKEARGIDKKIVEKSKAIVVDYCQPDIQTLINLMEIKLKNPDSYFIFITKDTCFDNTIDNILINTVSDFTIDCIYALKKLKSCLIYLHSGKQAVTITKNMRWYSTEKEKKLTRQESMVLPFIISGKKNKEISRYLDLSGKTISHYRRNIYLKFDVTTLAGLYHVFER
jgi:DNA-binding NarL/FixJ family response regulator